MNCPRLLCSAWLGLKRDRMMRGSYSTPQARTLSLSLSPLSLSLPLRLVGVKLVGGRLCSVGGGTTNEVVSCNDYGDCYKNTDCDLLAFSSFGRIVFWIRCQEKVLFLLHSQRMGIRNLTADL